MKNIRQGFYVIDPPGGDTEFRLSFLGRLFFFFQTVTNMATVVEVMTMFALRVRFKPRRRRRQRLFMVPLNDIPVSAITVVAFLLQQMSQIMR